jgi:hypothetical protein
MLTYVGLCTYVHTHMTRVTGNQTTHHCIQHRTSTTRQCCNVGTAGIAAATHTVGTQSCEHVRCWYYDVARTLQ